MGDKNTQANELAELIAISGELPANAIYRLGGGESYKEKLVTNLKKSDVIKTYYKDGLRGYRLTAKTKKELLFGNPDRFKFYLTGMVETNRIQSDIKRRLRLHRVASVNVIMYQAGVKIFRDDKPDVFNNNNEPVAVTYPAFYGSREYKELDSDMIKVKNARAVGILLTNKEIHIVYNTENYDMKWDYKSEISMKAIVRHYLCLSRMKNQYSSLKITGLLFGNNMEMLYRILSGGKKKKRSYFFLDGTFDEFIYLTNDRYGEVMLKLLCDIDKRKELNSILRENLYPPDRNTGIENDAVDENGDPVLYAYLIDMPRLARFVSMLELQDRTGTVICFDFQKEILSKFCGGRVEFETIDFKKFEGSFFP